MKMKADFHLQLYATSPAPRRDYHGLTITSEHVILNSWDISHGPHVYPRRRRLSLDNISLDKGFCSELQVLFGRHVLDYIHRVAQRDANLDSLPERAFRKIVGYLAVGDVVRMGQASKIFFEMCNTNAIWKILFQKKLQRSPTPSELNVAETMSWRHMLHRRVLEKRETKKIGENFKNGVDNLRRQTTKEAEKIRKNSRISEISIYERKPPEDKFKTKKIPVKTFKLGDENNIKKSNETKLPTSNQKVTKNVSEKTITSKTTVVKKCGDSSEKKIENDLRTKSSSQLIKKSENKNNKNKAPEKNNLKLNKSAKDIQNLKSKSVFM